MSCCSYFLFNYLIMTISVQDKKITQHCQEHQQTSLWIADACRIAQAWDFVLQAEFWGTSVWKSSYHINTAVNAFTLPTHLSLFPALQRKLVTMGILLKPSTSQKQTSAQSHWSLDKRSVGERGENEPNTAAGPLPGQEPRNAIRMELRHGWTFSSISVSRGWGVFEIPVLFRVCSQLPVLNSVSFTAPGLCDCSRVSPNSPPERTN